LRGGASPLSLAHSPLGGAFFKGGVLTEEIYANIMHENIIRKTEMSKPKYRRYYLLFYGTIAICMDNFNSLSNYQRC
jgi:hypothetical protein